MNERIRELAKEATSTVSVNHEGYRVKRYTEQVEVFDKEKFAELIVKECMNVVGTAVDQREPASTYVGKIKQHFGVEE